MNKISADIPNEFEVEKLRKNRRIIVFLICVIISTSLWFLNALSKEYTTVITYPVKFFNPPEKQFLAGEIPTQLKLRVTGKGFTLLQYKMLNFSPVKLDISEFTKNITPDSGSYRILTRSFYSAFTEQIGNDLTVSEINPEMINIVLDKLTTKTVPVKLVLNVGFVAQMNLKVPVSTNPDRVSITGPAIFLNKIDSLKTIVNIVNKLDASVSQEIVLLKPENTTIQPEKVQLSIEVEKYTEKEVRIPVVIKNKPQGSNIILFPSEIKVLFNVGLSRFEQIKAADFGAEVDCDSIDANVNNLDVRLYRQPTLIQGVKLNPEKVEFLIETK